MVGKEEAAATRKVILSGYLAQGKEASLFESELCAFTGHQYGLAVSSGTAALYTALKALKISSNDSVIIPSFACTALANAVHMCGATPALSDVEYENGLMSVSTIRKALKKSVRAIIVPHLFGYPVAAHIIEKELGIPVIEDCAQCVGASIDGKTTGSLTALAVFSFYATKVLCAGEGGLVTTSDKKIASLLEALREYDNKPKYEAAFNFKCSDVHAAIARVQLRKLSAFVQRRRIIADMYDRAVSKSNRIGLFPTKQQHCEPMYFRYIVRIRPSLQKRFIAHMESCGISVAKPVFKPFHTYGSKGEFPVSDLLYKELVSIPIYPALSEVEVGVICEALLDF
jgi:dTDP-4-amino-4,6-dideoxygalactose transaminase